MGNITPRFVIFQHFSIARDSVVLPEGRAEGYGTEGDALPRVTQTKDGVDLNVIWKEMQTVLAEWNTHREAVVSLVSFWHASVADPLFQGDSQGSFELASEFGEPQALRPRLSTS